LNKKWRQAGEVYLKMATLCKSAELKDPSGAAANTHRAAEAFQNHGDLTRSLAAFRSAAQTLFDTNRAPAAAKCWTGNSSCVCFPHSSSHLIYLHSINLPILLCIFHIEIAKIEEKEGRLTEAKEAWEKCAICHEESKASALAVQSRLNIARVLSLQGHLDQAAAMWERIASVEAEGELSRWYTLPQLCAFYQSSHVTHSFECSGWMDGWMYGRSCTDYYFKAGICLLVVDAKFTGAGVSDAIYNDLFMIFI
jgi:tetratricopeptide (TPR) repeat protein